MLASRALSTARRRRGLLLGSPPPSLAATGISLMSRGKTLPFFASPAPLRGLIFPHLLCPAMTPILKVTFGAMPSPLLIAKNDTTELVLLPALANRHGLITGTTGTGKTVTLQALAQRFSEIGVPVFMADGKGG